MKSTYADCSNSPTSAEMTVCIAGYAEIGVTAYRKFKLSKGEIEIRGDVKNLLDKQYEIVSHYPMPGRSWQVTVNYEF